MPISLGIERLRPQLEDIVAARPAVVVRSYGGDARLDGQLNAMGIRVVRLGFPMAFADARRDLRRVGDELGARARSEEHTSELQSLMRISYAVFCLKKKTN